MSLLEAGKNIQWKYKIPSQRSKQLSFCTNVIPYGSLQAEEEQTLFRFAN